MPLVPDEEERRRSVRTKRLELAPRPDDTFEFSSSLTDQSFDGDYEAGGSELTIHDFRISGTIDADLMLTSLEAAAVEHPFAVCPLVTAAVPGLVGENVSSGWRRSVLERFSGTSGCTHVTTLLLGLSEVITLVYFQRMNAETAYGPVSRGSGEWIGSSLQGGANLIGACHGLAPGGEVIALALSHVDGARHPTADRGDET